MAKKKVSVDELLGGTPKTTSKKKYTYDEMVQMGAVRQNAQPQQPQIRQRGTYTYDEMMQMGAKPAAERVASSSQDLYSNIYGQYGQTRKTASRPDDVISRFTTRGNYSKNNFGIAKESQQIKRTEQKPASKAISEEPKENKRTGGAADKNLDDMLKLYRQDNLTPSGKLPTDFRTQAWQDMARDPNSEVSKAAEKYLVNGKLVPLSKTGKIGDNIGKISAINKDEEKIANAEHPELARTNHETVELPRRPEEPEGLSENALAAYRMVTEGVDKKYSDKGSYMDQDSAVLQAKHFYGEDAYNEAQPFIEKYEEAAKNGGLLYSMNEMAGRFVAKDRAEREQERRDRDQLRMMAYGIGGNKGWEDPQAAADLNFINWEYGAYDNADNVLPRELSPEKRQQEIASTKAAIAEQERIIAEYKAGGTPEERAAQEEQAKAWMVVGNYKNNRPWDFETEFWKYDKDMYDAVNGVGSYNARINGAENREDEMRAVHEEVKPYWVQLDSGEFDDRLTQSQGTDKTAAQANSEYELKRLQRKLEGLEEAENAWQEARNYEIYAQGDSSYHSELFTTENMYFSGSSVTLHHRADGEEKDKADEMYIAVNERFANKDVNVYALGDAGNDYNNAKPEHFMSAEQVATFNKYYNSGDKESAMAYYQALEPWLNQMAGMYSVYAAQRMTYENPIVAHTMRLTLQPAAGIVGMGNAIAGIIDPYNKELNDKWSNNYRLTRDLQAIQQADADRWGKAFESVLGPAGYKIGSYLNGISWSIRDNLYSMMMGKAVGTMAASGSYELSGKIAEGITLLSLSSSAGAQEHYKNIEAGMDPVEAGVRSLAAMFVEYITEKVSWDHYYNRYIHNRPQFMEELLHGDRKALLVSTLVQGGIEGIEEINADILNWVSDEGFSALFGHETELQIRAKAIKKEAEEAGKSISDEDAMNQARKEKIGDALLAGLGGFISGIALGTGTNVTNSVTNRSMNVELGESILSQGTKINENLTEDQKKDNAAIRLKNGTMLLEAAEKMPAKTKANQEAAKLRKTLKAGKMSSAQFGRLARIIMSETGLKINNIVESVTTERIKDEMKNRGDTNAEKVAPIAAKVVLGQEITKREQNIFERDSTAVNIATDYIKNPDAEHVQNTKNEIKEKTRQEQNIQEAVRAMIPHFQANVTSDTVNRIREKMEGAETVDPKGNEALLAQGKRTESKTNVLADGKFGEIKGFKFQTVKENIEETDENGETRTVEADVRHTLAVMDDTREVDLSKVMATDQRMASFLQYMQIDADTGIGNNIAQTIMQKIAADENADAAELVAYARDIVAQTYFNEHNKTKLNPAVEQELREAAIKDIEAEDESRLQGTQELKPGEGQAYFDGAKYGTKEFNQKIKNLSNEKKNEVEYIVKANQLIGTQVHFFYDEATAGKHGYYMASDGIHINLAATLKSRNSFIEKSALTTFAHEATHMLQAYSKDGYAQLRNFVLQTMMKNNRQNIGAALEDIINSYRRGHVALNIHDAVAELVSKSCETILTNENLIRQLQETNPELHSKMRTVVQKLVDKIRSVINKARQTASPYSWPYQSFQELEDKLASLWLTSLREAQNVKGRQANTAESRVQLSLQDLSQEARREAKYSLAGSEANAQYGDDVARAIMMDWDGATPQQILEETGCIQGYRGKWWRVIDNDNMHLRENVQEMTDGSWHNLSDVFDAKELYEAYPQLKKVKVRFQNLDEGTWGMTTNEGLTLNANLIQSNVPFLEEVLRHEIQHVIQGIEKSFKGSNPQFWANMQTIARGRFEIAEGWVARTLEKYGLGEESGLQFYQDGTIDDTKMNSAEKAKVQRMSDADAQIVADNYKAATKWAQILNNDPESLYEFTVGEIEARAAQRTGAEQYQQIDYSNAVAVEDYTKWSIQELDQEYAQAVEDENWAKAEDMLLAKMLKTSGIVGYNALHFYSGEHQDIARMIKTGNAEIIRSIAQDMAEKVPENAVLIPMPPHEGKVLDTTDTLILANAISEITGSPVIKALESDYHTSRYKAKETGNRNVTAEKMGFRQVEEIPEDAMPVFIDNMVGGGTTAIAAHNAIGRGITLAYAQSSRAKSQGVKVLSVTYDKEGKLIPLSQRMDPNNKSWKYSVQEYYEKVVPRNKDYFENIFKNHPNIDVIEIVDPVDVQITNGIIDTNKVLEQARSNENVKTFKKGKMKERYYVHVDDLYIDVEIPGDGIRHNFSRNKSERENNIANALVAQYVAELLPHAVEVNRGFAHRNKSYYEHILVAAVRFTNTNTGKHQDYAVRFVVNNNKQQQAELAEAEIIGTLNSIKEKQVELTGLNGKNANRANANPAYTIKLSGLFDDVKYNLNDTFAEKIYTNAGVKRSNGNFASKLMYSMQDSNDAYMAAVENGEMETAQRMVDEYAEKKMMKSRIRDEEGKLLPVYHGTSERFTVFDRTKGRANMDIQGIFFSPWEIDAGGYGENVGRYYLNITNPASEAQGYKALRMFQGQNNAGVKAREYLISQGYDGVNNGNEEFIAFNPEQIKSADPVTYDDNGKVIPLSERFNNKKEDIRWSIQDNEIRDDSGEKLADVLPGGTVAKYSYRSWNEDNEQTLLNKLVNAGFGRTQAMKWIHDVNSIASIIAMDRMRLDYRADRSQRFKKPNADVYRYTLDASTLCAKRLLYQGTFNEIQKLLPNTPLRPGDLIELANMMHEMGFQTPCGICYVESRRRHTGNAAEQWLQNYDGEYIPNYAELTTTDGLARLKEEHPQAYKDFIKAMNKRGSGSVKLVQTRTDYRKDLRRMSQSMVDYLNSVGGIRVQSFSDFETPHLIDMMQAVIDMAIKGLKSQGYTKVPNFAWVFGDTGIKINLSLMGEGNGLDANGNLIFSSTEGMDFDEAMKLRNRYSKNVGTILVGMNEAHIIAAMGDARIDFIIPFHKSGWSQEEFEKMTTLKGYEDFEKYQNEKHIVGTDENGNYIVKSLDKGENNIMPEEYWEYSLNGTQNAQRYLELCKERGLQPKFWNFLVDNGDGSYSLPTDNSERSQNIRNGYWKTLIDFKMYDNDGAGAPQQNVTPTFNMQEAFRVMDEYEGGANTLPVAQPVVDRYVKWYKEQHPERSQFSMQDVGDMEARAWIDSVQDSQLRTEAEKELVQNYKSLRMRVSLKGELEQKYTRQIAELRKMLEKNGGKIGPGESLENALESIGAAIELGKYVKMDGQIVADLRGNEIRFKKYADATVRAKFKAAGFEYDLITKKWTYQNKGSRPTGTRAIEQQIKALETKREKASSEKHAAEEKLAEITGSQGYARLMYDHQRTFNDFMYGKTQSEVQESVNQLESSVNRLNRMITENQQKVNELAKTDAMKRMREILESTTRDQAVAELKRMYHSTYTKAQLQPYMEEIIVKMAAGEDAMPAIEELAEILVESDSTKTFEGLSALKGLTITIGKGEQKEMRGKHESLASYRQKLEGTGVKLRFGDTSTLDKDVEDLRAEFPGMPEFGNDLNALDEFVDWVNGMRGRETDEFYDQYKAEAMGAILDKATAAMANGRMYIPSDAKAKAQILELVDYIKALSKQTTEAQEMLNRIGEEMKALQAAGKRASGMAGALSNDLATAIDYYNTTAKLAQDTERKNRQTQLIQQLKSEAAQKIAKNNEEWRALIERDARARKASERIRQKRGQINTVIKRLMNKLANPKGLDNIPEHVRGLARELVGYIVDNDAYREGGRKISLIEAKDLQEMKRVLGEWEKQDGVFNIAEVKVGEATSDAMNIIMDDIQTLDDTIRAWSQDIRGKNKVDTLTRRLQIIEQMQEAVSEIYGFIQAEVTISKGDRRIAIADAANSVIEKIMGKKAKEWTGNLGRKIAAFRKMVISGNMTPEYFFRMLANPGLWSLWEGYHEAENRNGLELAKAKTKLAEIADKHGFDTWDLKQKSKVNLHSGEMTLTLGQMMSLYATWKREQTLGPQMSQHLEKGGFYAEQDLREGIIGKTTVEKKAHRFDETDFSTISQLMTEEQMQFVDDVVELLSKDMSELGNEASMKAYGIKMYKESYYFPMQMWDGNKNRKSNEAGSAAAANDRAFHPSFSKTRKHGASNALMIGDFMQTAVDHIAGMINYATMGLANENLQKVLNYTITEGDATGETTRRNVQAVMDQAYGAEAMSYLRELQAQLNGGAVRTTRDAYDKLLSMFRKNAVAGSLSVALQQPLSYIRAAMLIDPKYLAAAINPKYWKGSYKEMMAHSGVAVIKDMGRFDMNAGQSAREYLTPDGLESKGRKAWNAVVEYSTILPELMDRMTWTRMWSAVKAEQHALDPNADVNSEEFLNKCGVRFNEVMRRTQVYDSTLVRSENMRSDSKFLKGLTSFMAEPTLTLNVLADSVRSAKEGEAGGMRLVRRAAATFVLSAMLQSLFKAIMASGRTPDEKKTWFENFLYRYGMNFISEINPLGLIPGYSDMITILKGGKLEDDALGALGKVFTAGGKIKNLLTGEGNGGYRDFEDSFAQLIQLFSGLPLKNLMRDARAMWNWFVDQPYANRASDWGIIKYQMVDSLMNADDLWGTVNKWLGDAGYKTNSTAYYERIYRAQKAGDTKAADDMISYLVNGKGVKRETLNAGLKKAAKGDENASAAETAEYMAGEGMDADDYILQQVQAGELSGKDALRLLKEQNPDADEDSLWWRVDRAEYKRDTGSKNVSGTYYRMYDAISANKAADITGAVKTMMAHGVKPENIRETIGKKYRKQYLEAKGNDKVKLKNALILAYKATGMSETDANATINKWK